MVDQKGEFPEVFYGGIRPVASPLSRPISSLLQRQKHGQSGVLQPSRREGPGGHRWLARSGGARLVEEPSVALLGLRGLIIWSLSFVFCQSDSQQRLNGESRLLTRELSSPR